MNQERVFNILLEPHISEKVSILGDAHNQYGFRVAKDATKSEIKEAVEFLFEVTVERVTTLNVKGKMKRNAYRQSRRNNWKKAYVSVTPGQEIDFMVVGGE
tara:strand:+ start:383 stop:685 length:303 start_codon:yes stop_codon:yes gene_type:complete